MSLMLSCWLVREAATAVDNCWMPEYPAPNKHTCHDNPHYTHTAPGHLPCDTRESHLHTVQSGLQEITNIALVQMIQINHHFHHNTTSSLLIMQFPVDLCRMKCLACSNTALNVAPGEHVNISLCDCIRFIYFQAVEDGYTETIISSKGCIVHSNVFKC